MQRPKLAVPPPLQHDLRQAEGPFPAALWSRSRRLLAMVALWAAALTFLAGCSGSAEPSLRTATEQAAVDATLEVVIPAGAGGRIAAGEDLTLLPAEVSLRVGDVLRIVNHDDRTHVVGPFSVQAGETLTQRFTSAGSYRGGCTVHPSGALELKVLP